MNARINIAILNELAHCPEGYATRESSLIAAVALAFPQAPTDAEIRAAIRELQEARYISGATHALDHEIRWQITPNGRIALDTL